MASDNKKSQVTDLHNFLTTSSHFVLIGFEKTTHIALENLRRELAKVDSKVRVVKNTLLEKAIDQERDLAGAIKKGGADVFPLKASTALMSLGEDYAKGLAAFFKFAQANKTVSFKFGFLDRTLFMANDLEKIAKLPSKNELLAKLIGSFKAPAYRTVRAMEFPITKLTLVLKERAKQAN
jgi:large subunit ribosomal protein L10